MFNKEISEVIETTQEITKTRTVSQSYNEINLIIKRCGDGITRIVETAEKLHEPNFRDLFLSAVDSHENYFVEAEATNRKGRTDLKIFDRQLDIPYIYEFKIHKGIEDIKAGLEQITKQYATVSNRSNGLVLINTKQCDLSTVMSSIEKLLPNAGLEIKGIKTDPNQHKLVVKHQHHLDININCILTIFLFDIQQLKKAAK